jgi:hypothetical protein
MIREKTIFTEWLDESHAEGLAEGESKGEKKGKHLLLLKQIEKRFGWVSDEIKQAIELLDSEDSDALAVDLFDLRTADDLKLWLRKMAIAK